METSHGQNAAICTAGASDAPTTRRTRRRLERAAVAFAPLTEAAQRDATTAQARLAQAGDFFRQLGRDEAHGQVSP